MKANPPGLFKIFRVFTIIGVSGVLLGFIAFQVASDPKKEIRMRATTGAKSINAKASTFYLDTGKLPESIDELLTNVRQLQGWRGPYITEQQSKDRWGHRYIIRTPGLYSEIDVISLGADGMVGGVGANADFGNWK